MWKMPMKDSGLIRNRGITRLFIFVCHTRKCMIEASHLFRVIALDRTNMISVVFYVTAAFKPIFGWVLKDILKF